MKVIFELKLHEVKEAIRLYINKRQGINLEQEIDISLTDIKDGITVTAELKEKPIQTFNVRDSKDR